VSDPAARDAVTAAFRDGWATVVATLIRVTGDWALAEECAQDAFEAALRHWPVDGVPHRPGAWLTVAARNRALDRLRRSTTEAAKLQELALLSEPADGLADGAAGGVDDDRLRLIFTCCHPALAPEGRVALTLRTVGGLAVPEIARAFLVGEATMAQRLVRARRKIRNAGIPFRVPPEHQLPERTAAVLAVVYLLFNAGYTVADGVAPIRGELTAEAVRLARLLARLLPDDPEVQGLLALLLLTEARRPARLGAEGEPVVLEEQDRARWDAAAIAEGVAVLDRPDG